MNPTNAGDGPFQYAFNTSQHYFAWVRDHQSVLAQFNNHMSAYRQGRPSWMDPDFYPVQDLLHQGARTDEHAVLLVDVGGGLGHDIEEFHRKHPAAPGRLVLQDLPAVLGQIECVDDAITTMAHDFFTEQPIKGMPVFSYHRRIICDNQENYMTYYSHADVFRCPRLLQALHPPRLDGRGMFADPRGHHCCHEARLQ